VEKLRVYGVARIVPFGKGCRGDDCASGSWRSAGLSVGFGGDMVWVDATSRLGPGPARRVFRSRSIVILVIGPVSAVSCTVLCRR